MTAFDSPAEPTLRSRPMNKRDIKTLKEAAKILSNDKIVGKPCNSFAVSCCACRFRMAADIIVDLVEVLEPRTTVQLYSWKRKKKKV